MAETRLFQFSNILNLLRFKEIQGSMLGFHNLHFWDYFIYIFCKSFPLLEHVMFLSPSCKAS